MQAYFKYPEEVRRPNTQYSKQGCNSPYTMHIAHLTVNILIYDGTLPLTHRKSTW